MMRISRNLTAMEVPTGYGPLSLSSVDKLLTFSCQVEIQRGRLVGCYLALTIFVVMLYIVFDALALFFILAGSVSPRGVIIHVGYMLGRYPLRILVKAKEEI